MIRIKTDMIPRSARNDVRFFVMTYRKRAGGTLSRLLCEWGKFMHQPG